MKATDFKNYYQYYKALGKIKVTDKNKVKKKYSSLPVDAKPIPKHPTYYATPNGEIWRKHNAKIGFTNKTEEKIIKLTPGVLATGYCQVQPYVNGKRVVRYVHRLVLSAFEGLCPKGKNVDHIDMNPQNNQLSNLRYLSVKENLGRRLAPNPTYEQGRKKHKSRKRKYAEILPLILQLREEGKRAGEIALKLDIPIRVVYRVRS